MNIWPFALGLSQVTIPFDMIRKNGTDKKGNPFSDAIKHSVWIKASVLPGHDPDIVRKDECGALIEWDKYGDTTEGGRGWEIDHIKPVAKGGKDDLSNLQPLQWQNNREKGNKHPAFNYCIMPTITF